MHTHLASLGVFSSDYPACIRWVSSDYSACIRWVRWAMQEQAHSNSPPYQEPCACSKVASGEGAEVA